MELIYLDNNCFQRHFDDLNQGKVYLEAQACAKIFEDAKTGKIVLCWSFINEEELMRTKETIIIDEVLKLSKLCKHIIKPNEKMLEFIDCVDSDGFRGKDGAHLGCAIYDKIKYFYTCDHKFRRMAIRLDYKNRYGIVVRNPLEYLIGD